ncbi:MAG: hypothetical protein LC772_08065 [Chloroflexi bacterium]|nr:hypothetical protein [Chloroflexota bacterium]
MREIKAGWAVAATAGALFTAGCGGSGSQAGSQSDVQSTAPAPAAVRAASSGKGALTGTPGNKTRVAVLKVTGMT